MTPGQKDDFSDTLPGPDATSEPERRAEDSLLFAKWLWRKPGVCGGRTVIRGTRLEPRHIRDLIGNGSTIEDLMSERPDIDPMAFLAACRWASLYPKASPDEHQ